jgi:hypothetical protein
MPILNPKPINLEQLQLAIPELCDMLQDDLQEQWLKIIENMIDDGSIDFQPKPLTKDQFLAAWKERGFVERSQFIAQLAPLFMSMGSKDINTMMRSLAATCILVRIDDAAIAVDLDDTEEVSACSIEISEFKRLLNWETREGYAIDIAVRNKISQRAQSGGRAKYKDHAKAKEFVQQEWMEHRLAYEGNKSAFARDYVRRVANEYSVKVTEKTLREVWLHTPVASNDAG